MPPINYMALFFLIVLIHSCAWLKHSQFISNDNQQKIHLKPLLALQLSSSKFTIENSPSSSPTLASIAYHDNPSLSNKQLYFKSLLSHYQQFANFQNHNSKEMIRFCPHVHSIYQNAKAQNINMSNISTIEFSADKIANVALYPEALLLINNHASGNSH